MRNRRGSATPSATTRKTPPSATLAQSSRLRSRAPRRARPSSISPSATGSNSTALTIWVSEPPRRAFTRTRDSVIWPLLHPCGGLSPTRGREDTASSAATKGEGEMMGTAGTTKGIRQLLVIAGALVALAAASASPARAGDGSLLGCGHEPVHPFLQWLDPLPYTLLPGGDFESGAAGWKLSGGARVVDGNEPFYVTATSDSHSLLLPPGARPRARRCAWASCCRSSATSRAAASRCPRSASRPSTRTPRAGSGRLDLLPPAACRPSRGRRACRRCSCSARVNALTLNGLTSEIALRFTPRGLSSAAAPGGSTTSTSIPGRSSSAQPRASTCSRAAPVPTSSTVTPSSRSTSST